MKDQDWDIRERSETCLRCGRPFVDRQPFVSLLEFGPEGYVRQDFCEPCWPGVEKSRALSIWKSVFRPAPPPPEEPLKKETAESLLRRLMESHNLTHGRAIFILAVMLERRRVLAERDVQTREDGVKVRVYEHRRTGEVFLVPDPQLRLDQLEEVQREVTALLAGPAESCGAPGPAAPPPVAEPGNDFVSPGESSPAGEPRDA